MVRKRKLILISIITLLFLGGYFLLGSKDKEVGDIHSSAPNLQKQSQRTNNNVSSNKYYFVYIKKNNGNDSSFVPEKLNSGFRFNTGFNISIFYNDDGSIIKDEKMILIENDKLSNSNKEKIRKIAGEKNYADALKEIEERINSAKDIDSLK